MKAHVTLRKGVAADPALRRAAVERVLAAGQMTLGKPGRVERYGIITGEVKSERLDRIRAIPEVEAVELDVEEFAGRARGEGARSARRPRVGTRPPSAHS